MAIWIYQKDIAEIAVSGCTIVNKDIIPEPNMRYYILGRGGVKCEESQIFRNMQIASIPLFPQSLCLSFCSISLLKSLEGKSPVNYNMSSQGIYLSQGIRLLSIFLDLLFTASTVMPLKIFCGSSPSFPCSLNINIQYSKISPFSFSYYQK